MSGTGVDKSQEECFRWYKLAADQGHSGAQYHLGKCFQNGVETAKNTGNALKWFTEAADQGSATAQYKLGECYSNGTCVTRNDEEGFCWFRLTADQGLPQAEQPWIMLAENTNEAIRWFRTAADHGSAAAQYHLGVVTRLLDWCYSSVVTRLALGLSKTAKKRHGIIGWLPSRGMPLLNVIWDSVS
jgi:TPR repeat protein